MEFKTYKVSVAFTAKFAYLSPCYMQAERVIGIHWPASLPFDAKEIKYQALTQAKVLLIEEAKAGNMAASNRMLYDTVHNYYALILH